MLDMYSNTLNKLTIFNMGSSSYKGWNHNQYATRKAIVSLIASYILNFQCFPNPFNGRFLCPTDYYLQHKVLFRNCSE